MAKQEAVQATDLPPAVDAGEAPPPATDAGTPATEQPAPAPRQKSLTEAQVRAIVREEMAGLLAWQHDAAHMATQAQVTAQWERDKAAGVAAPVV